VSNLKELAEKVGNDWSYGPYYDDAERAIEAQWRTIIWPMIQDCDFSTVLDLAAGHGRNTALLLQHAARVIAVDIRPENIAFMRERFAQEKRLVLIQNDGTTLSGVEDASVTLAYSFDAMVHFYPDVVFAYQREFSRVMIAGAHGFVHYSNNHRDPKANYRDHPGWRNYMSARLFEDGLRREGLEPLKTIYIKHTSVIISEDDGDCDAITLFRKPD
jgi:ubiquinone/menaquinone biosynthesis C-methylase UbiE